MPSLARLLLLALFVAPAAARADWLNLSDGAWDLTLTCDFVDPAVSCPGSFHALLTISGAGISALSATFDNETFSGDPVDDDSTQMGITRNVSRLVNPDGVLFEVHYESDFPMYGLPPQGWGYCYPSANGCDLTYGHWTATSVSAVPEPAQWALIAVGLSGIGAARRRLSAAARTGRPAPCASRA